MPYKSFQPEYPLTVGRNGEYITLYHPEELQIGDVFECIEGVFVVISMVIEGEDGRHFFTEIVEDNRPYDLRDIPIPARWGLAALAKLFTNKHVIT
jgi:hypothetical protein